MFPWLSTIAGSYEHYRFTDLKVSMVSSQPTTAAGRYYMAIDLDYDDAVPRDAQMMMANMIKTTGNVWESLSLQASASQLHRDMPYKFVLSNKRVDPEPRTSYCGFLLVAFQGQASAVTFDLWVEYTVEFKSPAVDEETFYDAQATTVTAASSLTVPATVAYEGRPEVTLSQPVPGIQIATSGTAGAPAFANNGVVSQKAYDMSKFLADELNYALTYRETGVTPANLLLKAPDVDLSIFDAVGNFLGLVSDVPSTRKTAGPATATQVNTATAPVKAVVNTNWDDIRAAYGAARYLVPILKAVSAVGAGDWRGGWFGW